MNLTLRKFQTIRGHDPIRAVVEVEYGGLLLRGLKLEEHAGDFRIVTAGRKVCNGWQLVYEVLSPELEQRLRDRVVDEYRRRKGLRRSA